MHWIRVIVAAAFGLCLTACADRPTENTDRIAASTTTSTVADSVTATLPTAAPSTTPVTVVVTSVPVPSESQYSLAQIFSFLGERAWSLEAVGYDSAADHYVVYTKAGEGGPAIEYHDTLPPIQPRFELVDDGGGRTLSEQHMIIRNLVESFDAYWTEEGTITLRSLRRDADPFIIGDVLRLVARPEGRILFLDADAGNDGTSILRSLIIGEDGNSELEWAVEFESEILFALNLSNGVLVATAEPGRPEAETIDRIHLVEPSGFTRSIKAPPGLVALQRPLRSGNDLLSPQVLEPCGGEQIELAANGLHGVESWHIDTSHQLITACADDVPISTTTWCCGMGEYLGIMDSNGDGVEEVFVGGTSVGAAGAGVYSLVGGQLAAIETDDGGDLEILSGDFGDRYFRHGCRDGTLVQVVVEVDGARAWADRTTYRIDGHLATAVGTSRREWDVEAGSSAERAHDDGPPEIVADLFPCQAPVYRELAGTDGLRIHIRPHALSNAASCEVQWPRPYAPLMLTSADGSEWEWQAPGNEEISLHWIAPDDFIATDDGRFALLDYFPCSHEGTIKTIYAGRYDPATGELLEWRRVEPPADFVSERLGYQRHPDQLVITDDGSIVGELDTGTEVLRIELG